MMPYYLAATVAVFAICFLAYRSRPAKYADLMGVSVMLSLVFAMVNLLIALYGLPDSLLSFPVLDLTLAAMIYRAWRNNKEPWKVVMVGSLVMQLMLHLVTIAMWKTGRLTQMGLHEYVVAINAIFIVQLATLAGVGVGHGMDCLRRRVPDRGRVHPVADGGR